MSSLSIGGSSRRKRKDEGALDLESYHAARLASGLTTAEDYAQAARELAELLERGYATAEKRCADALWEDCLLAVSRTAHLERTVETTDSSDAVLRVLAEQRAASNASFRWWWCALPVAAIGVVVTVVLLIGP